MITLQQIAQEEGYVPADLEKIFITLPTGDAGEITFLEAAGQSILEVSELVELVFPQLLENQKTASKLRLMGKLLLVKSSELS